MKCICKIIIFALLTASLVAWSSPSEARRGRHHAGHGQHFGHGHHSIGFFGFYGGRHFQRPHRFQHHRHRYFRHRPHHYHHGHYSDRVYVYNFHYTLENNATHETTTWRNPDNGDSETITPVETFQTKEGRYCREFVKTVTIGGEEQQAYGTACRQPDGNWVIAEQ